MQAIGLEKDELVQALGLHFTVSTLALAGVLWSGNAFTTQIVTLSLIAIVPAVIGMIIGQRVRHAISVAYVPRLPVRAAAHSWAATRGAKSALMAEKSR